MNNVEITQAEAKLILFYLKSWANGASQAHSPTKLARLIDSLKFKINLAKDI